MDAGRLERLVLVNAIGDHTFKEIIASFIAVEGFGTSMIGMMCR
jgi:hypothetical protein